MSDRSCHVVVLGGGPGGYACAARAGSLGLDVVLIDAGGATAAGAAVEGAETTQGLGGACLHVGCVPSKALIRLAAKKRALDHGGALAAEGVRLDLARAKRDRSALIDGLARGVASLLARAGVATIRSRGRFLDGKTIQCDDGARIHAENVVIATGSAPIPLPTLPFGGPILTSADLLALERSPATLAVVGGGYIGLELGQAMATLGAEVFVIEARERILEGFDAALIRPVADRLARESVDVVTGARVEGHEDGLLLFVDRQGALQKRPAEKVLVTVGRKPMLDDCGVGGLGLDMDGPFLAVDRERRTSMRGIYAIGDVAGQPMLAHKATAEGEMVAEILAGRKRRFEPAAIPAICFTEPEIVHVGLSPEAARATGYDVVTANAPFRANARALIAEDSPERQDAEPGGGAGFVRVVARADNHLLLGLSAVGVEAGELANAFALALEMRARLEDLADTVFAHPTIGESAREAALMALAKN